MATYTVVAAYRDPPSMFSTVVEADTPADALAAAWDECCDGNGWEPSQDQDEEWSDTIVFEGESKVADFGPITEGERERMRATARKGAIQVLLAADNACSATDRDHSAAVRRFEAARERVRELGVDPGDVLTGKVLP